MSLATMSTRDRRALLLGVMILAPALAFIWGVRPFLASLDRTREQIFEQRQLLSHEQAAVAAARQNPDLQGVADSAMRAMIPRLFEGRDDVMATAELVSHLGEIARANDMLLPSAATRPTVLANGVRMLRVEIRGESDLSGVLSFLQAIEGGEKLLRVERLDISRSLAATEVDGIEPLAVAASIVGFAIPDSTAVASPVAPRAPQVPRRPVGGAR
jgi:hypothetical protein